MDLEIKLKQMSPEFTICYLSGSLDFIGASSMEKNLLESIGTIGEHFGLVVYLDNLEFIDTSGLAALVRIRRVLHAQNGKIGLICMKPHFKKLFHLAGLAKLFSCFENEEQAIKAMSEPKYKESVLLIEDSVGFRLLFRDELEQRGYVVWEAEDGVSGLELAQNRHPNLILLDLLIPKLRGLEVLKQIKSSPYTKGIRVVILSVVNDPKDKLECLGAGADDYIVKGSDSIEGIIRRSCTLLTKV